MSATAMPRQPWQTIIAGIISFVLTLLLYRTILHSPDIDHAATGVSGFTAGPLSA